MHHSFLDPVASRPHRWPQSAIEELTNVSRRRCNPFVTTRETSSSPYPGIITVVADVIIAETGDGEYEPVSLRRAPRLVAGTCRIERVRGAREVDPHPPGQPLPERCPRCRRRLITVLVRRKHATWQPSSAGSRHGGTRQGPRRTRALRCSSARSGTCARQALMGSPHVMLSEQSSG